MINNKYVQLSNNQINEGLFGGNYSSMSYLIPEKKSIDYFLKLEGCNNPLFIKNLINDLNNIDQIITSYSIEPNSLKSKDHLIF